jgi:hypothetical protein
VARHEAEHGDDPEADDHVEHGLLVLGALRPEVDQHDAHTVEGVEHDRADEGDLTEAHDGRLVGADHGVVCLGRHTNERGVEDVNEKEEEDGHTGDSVENP